jgi:thioredoxin 1
MSAALEVSNDSFEQEVMQSETPVLVDFWAPWCGPCRALSPHIDRIAGQYGSQLKVVKVNTDEAQDVASRFGIMSIPTVILFKGGQELGRVMGNVPDQVNRLVTQNVAA